MEGGGLRRAFSDLAGALVPLSARELEREFEERLARIPNRLNEYGFDAYGLEAAASRRGGSSTSRPDACS